MLETFTVLAHERRQNKGKGGGIVHGGKCRTTCEEQEVHVGEHVRNLQVAEAVLHRAEELSGTAQTQILLGEAKAVARLLDDLEPLLGRRAPSGNEDAVGGIGAAPDTPAQLMQLGESEALGMLHDEDARIRHVDADLDDRGRNEQLDAIGIEALHHGFLLRRLHAPVQKPAGNPAKDAPRQFLVDLLDAWQVTLLARFNERANDICLPPAFDLSAHKCVDFFTCCFIAQKRPHGLPPRRQMLDARDIEIAIDRERHRARDRGRRHDEHIGRHHAFFLECRTLCHAEAMLFVRYDQPQCIK